MAISTLIVEDGTSKTDSNTYIDLAYANQYFEDRLDSDYWSNADDNKRNKAILMSTRILDTYAIWLGQKTEEDQALKFPRYGLEDDGYVIDFNVVPVKIQEAQAELCLFLLTSNRTADKDGVGLKELGVDKIKLVFDKDDKLEVLPESVLNLIAPFIGNQSELNIVRY